ncbi:MULTISPECIES: helix-turn-helix domain-containing protein [Dickeya]|uniref:helix-turn-helix domain-containing protein n=1 Tax=Dickeya TaxID=204037 RepID=UPI000687E62F|nr:MULTISPECIES: helix-turn-helix transcriptional regulator [Dickeya]
MSYKEKTDIETINRDRIIVSSGINRFRERLKEAMNGMSNSELARKSGMSETTIRKYLKGDIYPGIDSAAIVAYACNVSLVWLLCGIELNIEEETNSPTRQGAQPSDSILQRLSAEQAKMLSDAIIDHGVTGIITALKGMATVTDFLRLSENERAQVLRVYEQIKEGASQGDSDAAQRSLTTNKRQAG